MKEVGDVVKRGHRVKVKVLSITGNKMSLSMKVSELVLRIGGGGRGGA